ncbi:MAG: YbaN family protein [Bacteroidales bacterium]|nr:YbaN family protein [Bacteroidales bacterium]
MYKIFLMLIGSIFLVIGIIGIFIPLLPTTPLFLVAIACYLRSSKKLYNFVLNNKWFGYYIKSYIEKQGIPLKIKIFTLLFLWLTILFSVILVEMWIIRLLLLAIALVVTIHIISIKTKY